MIGNGGNDVFYVLGPDQVDAAAPGINTVITNYGWGVYTLPANVQNLIYDGTASYGNGWITLQGNTLNDTIVANNLGDELEAGTGNDTLVGGTGPDIFVVAAGDGSDTIINFHGGTASTEDTVQLQNLGFDSFAAVQAAMVQSGANTVLNLGGGQTLTFVNQQISSFTAAEFGLPATSGASGGSTGSTSGSGSGGTGSTSGSGGDALVTDPVIVQPTGQGQVVGFMLRNNGATAIGAHEVTFGQVFAAGEVPAGSQLVATIAGQQVAVQMDVMTTNPDGSVKTADLTLEQPALGADASVNGMLSLASTTTVPTPIKLSNLTSSNYNVAVSLDLQNADGTTTDYNLNAGTLLQQALVAGTATYILQGSQVTEAQFSVPISGSLYVTFNVSLFADGSTATNVAFNNDIALAATGGTAVYNATITQNGSVVLQQNDISQIQYTSWNQEVYSNGAPQAQVVQDIAALEATGAIPNYDLTAGVSASAIAAETSQLGGSTYGILGSASVDQYMPTTGGRADIGPQPEWNVVWLMTQDPGAETYALAQAAAAGSVPWSFINSQTGTYLTVTEYPTLWVDGRATTESSYTPLTQQVSNATGWTADAAHQPDLSYVAYLLTGDQQYLNLLNAQASWSESDDWTVPRQDGLGLVANGQDQVRQQAWSLREIDEAAYANPTGSAMKTYFTQMENNNWNWLVSQIPTWTAEEGQAYGYIPGAYGATNTTIAPWQQDYFVSTAVQAAEMGNQDAVTFLEWEANFIVGRFLNAADGFNPDDGVAYNLIVSNASGAPLQTWAAIEQATQAAGGSNGSGWAQSQGDYAQLAEQSLAGIITVTESTAAIQAYGWLLASGAPQLNMIAGTQFDIVPRLSDGQLLTANNIIISTDTTATTLRGTNNDQLIEAGSGNDTIDGGSGINILFAGSGTDVLIGGSNNDYLYAGSGTDTLSGGAGNNFMQAGSGADTFDLSVSDIANDIIAGFKLGTDHLVIAGESASSAFVSNLLQTMTEDAAGDAVLHLSPSHSVTLQGISESQVTSAMFGVAAGNSTVLVSAAAVSGETLTGGSGINTLVLTSAGTVNLGGVSSFATISLAAGNNAVTVTDATLSGGTVTISDGTSGNNSVSAAGDTTASSGKALNYHAGTGTDLFTGGFENDRVRVSAAAVGGDTLTGGSGANTLVLATAGNVNLGGVSKFATIFLAAGNNTVTLTDTTLSGGTVAINDGASGNNSVSAAGDTSASTGKALIYNAGSGTDYFTGEFENDRVRVSAAAVGGDTLTGGSGANTLVLTTAGNVNLGGVSKLATILLAAGNNSVTVTDTTLSIGVVALDDGSSGNNTVSAAGDTSASSGKELIYNAGSGTDHFTGGFESDRVRVSAAAVGGDTLTGGSGANTLLLTSAGNVDLGGISKFATIDLATGNNTVTVTNTTLSGGSVAVHGGASGNNSVSAAGDTSASTGKTLTYYTGTGTDTFTGGVENDTIVAVGGSLSAGDAISGGTGTNTLMLSGGGAFNLAAPTTLTNIQTVDAAEGQAAGGGVPNGVQIVDLRAGLNQTVNVASGTPNPLDPNPETITINGAANNDVINLGTGTDTVVLGGAGETVSGGGGTAFVNAAAAFAGALVNSGSGTTTLKITTGGTATLNANDNHLIVDLTSATNLTLSQMSFITAVGSTGNDTITAMAQGQTLTGGGGTDTLNGYSGFGDVFSDTSAHLNTTTIGNFGGSDLIDLTDMNSATIQPLAFNTGTETLTVTDGTHTSNIKFIGGYTLSDFAVVGSDGHSGTLVGYS